jgi:hypothetical protein
MKNEMFGTTYTKRHSLLVYAIKAYGGNGGIAPLLT